MFFLFVFVVSKISVKSDNFYLKIRQVYFGDYKLTGGQYTSAQFHFWSLRYATL